MKRLLLILAILAPLGILSLKAQNEASSLTLTGKLYPDTPNPYNRLDTVRFKGFTELENLQVREPSGIAVAFRTDSDFIRIKAEYGTIQNSMSTNGISSKGFDLYIKRDGKWIFAAAGTKSAGHENEEFTLIKGMDRSMHECLMYLPLFSELYSVKLIVREGAVLEASPNPFRHRVAIFGSSHTHGSSTSRSGMTYPAQFSRNTGIQLLSLGCSGNSKLQSYFAEALACADVDAFIFDAFSNPSAEQMKERLFPFIERIQASHPGKPLIFQRTIWCEGRNFNVEADKHEARRGAVADSLMQIACKKYKDVYYIYPNATSPDHLTSVDGIHPTNYGYTLWAKSIEKKVLRILRKYGIK